jgi:hypothetical protein
MKSNLTIIKTGFFAAALVFSSFCAKANTFTAIASGNFSSTSTWSGGVAPSSNTTNADQIVIGTGLTVNLDQNWTINNAGASFQLLGTLSSSTNSMNIQNGSITGALTGNLNIHDLTLGTASSSTYTGSMTLDNMYNSATVFSLSGAATVNDTLGLYSGVAQLATGAILTLGTNATINLGGGTYSSTGGLLTLGSSVNLLYSGSTNATTGLETSLTGLNNITVDMASSSGELTLSGDLAVTGQLNISNGNLNLNGHNLTINGTISAGTTGYIMGNSSSNININGTGSIGTLTLAGSNSTIGQLNLNIAGNGSVTLGSNMTSNSGISLMSGSLVVGSNTLTTNGAFVGSGYLITSSSSNLVMGGSGDMGTLNFSGSGSTVGNLTLNTGNNGNLNMGSDLTIAGGLTLSNGIFNMNGHNLTLNGTVNVTGSSSISSTNTSNLTIGGSSNSMGSLIFTTGFNTVNNLTLNGSSGSNASLASDLAVAGVLNLSGGNLHLTGTSNLSLTGTSNIQGGSNSSYISTDGSGSLIANIAASGSGMLQIGANGNYAPVNITNSSATSGNFSGNAHAGIFANGTTGNDISSTMSSVSTSWNIESDITTGANVSIEAFWSSSMEVNGFDTNTTYLSHYTSSAWDNSTSSQATVNANGMLSVKRTGITSFSPFAVFSSATTGIREVNNNAAFSTYPNPAINALTVSIANPQTANTLKVYDILGNQLAAYSVTDKTNTIDISGLTPGVYFLSVNNTYTKKFVKE